MYHLILTMVFVFAPSSGAPGGGQVNTITDRYPTAEACMAAGRAHKDRLVREMGEAVRVMGTCNADGAGSAAVAMGGPGPMRGLGRPSYELFPPAARPDPEE